MTEHQAPPQIVPSSLDDYLEVMSKAVFQSGMSWKVVENKWQSTREAFENFDVRKVANYDERNLEALEKDTRVIRNARFHQYLVWNPPLNNTFGVRNEYHLTCTLRVWKINN